MEVINGSCYFGAYWGLLFPSESLQYLAKMSTEKERESFLWVAPYYLEGLWSGSHSLYPKFCSGIKLCSSYLKIKLIALGHEFPWIFNTSTSLTTTITIVIIQIFMIELSSVYQDLCILLQLGRLYYLWFIEREDEL